MQVGPQLGSIDGRPAPASANVSEKQWCLLSRKTWVPTTRAFAEPQRPRPYIGRMGLIFVLHYAVHEYNAE